MGFVAQTFIGGSSDPVDGGGRHEDGVEVVERMSSDGDGTADPIDLESDPS